MIFLEEQWKAIVIEKSGVVYDYTGLYEVSNLGRVRSLNYNHTKKIKILKQFKNSSGYLTVTLHKNDKGEKFFVHRLVATAFIINDDSKNKTEVNHISEVKTDNNVKNLMWVTKKENCNFGTRNERTAKINIKIQGRKVLGKSLTETKVVILQSTRQGEKFGFCQSSISACCIGKYKKHKGYSWRYIEEEKELD